MGFSAGDSAQYTDLMNRIDPKRDSPHIDTDAIGLSHWMTHSYEFGEQLVSALSQICIIHKERTSIWL
jgi:hypothetical protein